MKTSTTGVYKLIVLETYAYPDGTINGHEREYTTVAGDLPQALHMVKMSRLSPTRRGDGLSVVDVSFLRAEYLGKVDFAA